MIASSFTKLFASITDSSIWSEDSDTKVVWVTMLAMADQFGRVNAAIPGLAKRANVSIEATEKALHKFLSPDPYSRTKDHEGRRIEPVEGGWRLLNHEFYREIRSDEDRKEQNRIAQQRRREKMRHQDVSNSQQESAESANTDAETETDALKKKSVVIPEGLNVPEFLTVWNEWMECRRKMKSVKDWSLLWRKQLEQLDEYGVVWAIKCLNASMANGWLGIFEPKDRAFKKRSTKKAEGDGW